MISPVSQTMNPGLLAAGLAVDRETNAAVGDVAAGTDRMAKNAALMTDSALLLGKNSSSVAAAAEEALTNAQTVAKASSQLSASIAEIASQANSSRKLTLEAVTASTHAQSTIANLSEAAGKVGAVTNLISEIASQTNLLALPRVAFRPKPWLRRVAALLHIVDRGVCKRNNLT